MGWRRRWARRVLVGVTVLGVVGAVVWPGVVVQAVRTVAGPMADVAAYPMTAAASVGSTVREWSGWWVIRREQGAVVRELEGRVAQLSGEVVEWRERAGRAERMAKMRRVRRKASWGSVVASVIGRSGSPWFEGVVVDRGADDGIRAGMGVMTAAGAVGRVVKVRRSVAVVLWVVDPNVSVSAMVQGSREEGVVQGTGSGLRLKYVRPLAVVSPGDVVVTAGLAGGFPRGVALGSVVSAGVRAGEVFLEAVVSPAVTPRGVEEVIIVTAPRDGEVQKAWDGVTPGGKG